MCGIIGIQTDDYDEKVLALIKTLLIESQIRGKHATGISWNKFDHIETNIQPIPAEKFVEADLGLGLFHKPLSLIGHCRYSTSDLEYNQPMADSEDAIVHNGVISQKDPSQWEGEYGLICKTRNDSELAFKSIKYHTHPIKRFPRASIALIHLNKDGSLNFYRNGTRPLWCCEARGINIIASTRDILLRTFRKMGWEAPKIKNCPMGITHTLFRGIMACQISAPLQVEQQMNLQCSDYYTPVNERLQTQK